MHFHVAICHDLMEASGMAYEQVLRIRPDLEILECAYPECIQVLQRMDLLCDGRPYIYEGGTFMVGDRLAFGHRSALKAYSSVHVEQVRRLPGILGMEGVIHPHRSLAYLLLAKGVTIGQLPARIGRMLGPTPLPLSALADALRSDAMARNDRYDMMLLDALSKDRAVRNS